MLLCGASQPEQRLDRPIARCMCARQCCTFQQLLCTSSSSSSSKLSFRPAACTLQTLLAKSAESAWINSPAQSTQLTGRKHGSTVARLFNSKSIKGCESAQLQRLRNLPAEITHCTHIFGYFKPLCFPTSSCLFGNRSENRWLENSSVSRFLQEVDELALFARTKALLFSLHSLFKRTSHSSRHLSSCSC